MTITLVLGGVRSGKSRYAESLAHGEKHYIATAQAFDDEMRERIAKHKLQRGDGWQTHEEPIDLAAKIKRIDGAGHFILVDCLTLWLTNLVLAEMNVTQHTKALKELLPAMQSDVVLVSNEVGLGIVPDTPLGRRFRDAQGILNQQVAEVAHTVVFIAAGLPLLLKGTLPQQAATPT